MALDARFCLPQACLPVYLLFVVVYSFGFRFIRFASLSEHTSLMQTLNQDFESWDAGGKLTSHP